MGKDNWKNKWKDLLLDFSVTTNKEEWENTNFLANWASAARISTLAMTIIASAIIAFLSIKSSNFNFLYWIILSVGLLSAHAANNLLNDFTDFLLNVDDPGYFRTLYGTHPLASGYISGKGFFIKYILPVGIVGLIAGGLLLYLQDNDIFIWLLFIVGSFLVLFYTWPLKKLGVGEFAVLLVWGPMMIAGGYYVVTGYWSIYVFLASIAYSCVVANVLIGVHTDKIKEDIKKKIKTFPVLVGEKKARLTSIALMVLPYFIVLFLFSVGFFGILSLFIFLTVPLLIREIAIFKNIRPDSAKEVKNKELKKTWPLYFFSSAFRFNRIFGLAYAAIILLDVLAEIIFY